MSDASHSNAKTAMPGRDRLVAALRGRYGDVSPDAVQIVRAPGRVNLIGEHTDYNGGFVLPAAIDLEIRIAFEPTADRSVELTRLDTGESATFPVDAVGAPGGTWIDYVAGVARELVDAGMPAGGLRGVLSSTLPISAGLSSSAALELASAWALRLAAGDQGLGSRGSELDRMAMARLAQRAENGYVGVRCGLMDQFAASLGRAGHAMLLDCRSLEFRPVDLHLGEHVLVVCDTTSPRRLAASAYNLRRGQCEHAVAMIAGDHDGVRSLRDVDEDMLAHAADRLDATERRRCEHVIAENERVLACVAAFERGDLAAVGAAFAASHRSLRDLYEVTSPELDALVEIALSVPGTVASRMTGAGFGGCTVSIVATEALPRFRATVEREYPARTGLPGAVHVVRAVDGAGLVA